jgi:hypothetical protein
MAGVGVRLTVRIIDHAQTVLEIYSQTCFYLADHLLPLPVVQPHQQERQEVGGPQYAPLQIVVLRQLLRQLNEPVSLTSQMPPLRRFLASLRRKILVQQRVVATKTRAGYSKLHKEIGILTLQQIVVALVTKVMLNVMSPPRWFFFRKVGTSHGQVFAGAHLDVGMWDITNNGTLLQPRVLTHTTRKRLIVYL